MFNETRFDTRIATFHGVSVAVVYSYIKYNCEKAKTQVFSSSMSQINAEYPFISIPTIRRAFKALAEMGAIQVVKKDGPNGYVYTFHPDKMDADVSKDGFEIVNVEEVKHKLTTPAGVYEAVPLTRDSKIHQIVRERNEDKTVASPSPSRTTETKSQLAHSLKPSGSAYLQPTAVVSQDKDSDAEKFDMTKTLNIVSDYVERMKDADEDTIDKHAAPVCMMIRNGEGGFKTAEYNYMSQNKYARDVFRCFFPHYCLKNEGFGFTNLYTALSAMAENPIEFKGNPLKDYKEFTKEKFREANRIPALLLDKEVWSAEQVADIIFGVFFGTNPDYVRSATMGVMPWEVTDKQKEDFIETSIRLCRITAQDSKFFRKAQKHGEQIEDFVESIASHLRTKFSKHLRNTSVIKYVDRVNRSNTALFLKDTETLSDAEIDSAPLRAARS
jgi:hypothetical protein